MPTLRERSRWLAALTLLFLGASAFFFVQFQRPRPHRLRMTGGDSLGRRHELARLLAEEGVGRGLALRVEECSGSTEALRRIEAGTLDVALIQGGEADPPPSARLVAALAVEPLHLLAKNEYAGRGLDGLRGRRLNLSTEGSGTRRLAARALEFAGMTAGRDYADEDRPYAQLEALSYDGLPDGVLLVSPLPSPVAEFLVRRHGYRFVPLPFGSAVALRDAAVVAATIPAYSYGVRPPAPAADVPTLGNRLLLVARASVPTPAVRALLDTVVTSEFARRGNVVLPDEDRLLRAPEMPVHPGATEYLTRNNPALTLATLQTMESLRSFLVSVAIALFFLARWSRRRRLAGFDQYMAEVTRLEKRGLELEVAPTLDLKELIGIRNRLSAVKTEALEKFADGQLRGEELMTGFLAHVADVRNYVSSLILHERERIAGQSSDTVPDDEQEARFRAGWSEAVGRPEDWRLSPGPAIRSEDP